MSNGAGMRRGAGAENCTQSQTPLPLPLSPQTLPHRTQPKPNPMRTQQKLSKRKRKVEENWKNCVLPVHESESKREREEE